VRYWRARFNVSESRVTQSRQSSRFRSRWFVSKSCGTQRHSHRRQRESSRTMHRYSHRRQRESPRSLRSRGSLRSSLRCGPCFARLPGASDPFQSHPSRPSQQSGRVGLKGATRSTKAAVASTAAERGAQQSPRVERVGVAGAVRRLPARSKTSLGFHAVCSHCFSRSTRRRLAVRGTEIRVSSNHAPRERRDF